MTRMITTLLTFFLIGSSTACSQASSQRQADPLPLMRFEESAAFQTLYPHGWEAFIPEQGIIVFAPGNVMEVGEQYASVTVYRDAPAGSDESLEELMDHFLDLGLLRGSYHLTSPIQDTMIGEAAGLMVEFSGDTGESDLVGRIEMVQMKNGAVYYFTATAPQESWEEDWLLMEQIIHQSVFVEK